MVVYNPPVSHYQPTKKMAEQRIRYASAPWMSKEASGERRRGIEQVGVVLHSTQECSYYGTKEGNKNIRLTILLESAHILYDLKIQIINQLIIQCHIWCWFLGSSHYLHNPYSNSHPIKMVDNRDKYLGRIVV